MNLDSKFCTRCGKIKSISDFNRDRTRPDGFNFYCRDCGKAKDRVRYPKYYRERGKKIKLGYSKLHREELREKSRRYKINHPEKFAELSGRMKSRMEADIEYRLLRYMQSRMCASVRQRYGEEKVIYLLGCSIAFLRNHLEEQFLPGMTWKNYGKWHIDHIVPTSWFPLGDAEWQKIAFHWTNLQPLWASDNISKNNRHCERRHIA